MLWYKLYQQYLRLGSESSLGAEAPFTPAQSHLRIPAGNNAEKVYHLFLH